MGKLITPVQYEPALEELNAVRPLQLQVRPRRILNIPILNKLPIESVKSIAGTLAKCTEQGSLLIKPPQDFTHYEAIEILLEEGIAEWYRDFTQKVYKILVYVYEKGLIGALAWTDPTWSSDIAIVNALGCFYWPFVGKRIYMRQNIFIGGYMFLYLIGFY